MHTATASDFYISYDRASLQLSKAFQRLRAQSSYFFYPPIISMQLRSCLRDTEAFLAAMDLASLDKEASTRAFVNLDSLNRKYRGLLILLHETKQKNSAFFNYFCGSLIGDVEIAEEQLDDIVETLAISLDDGFTSMLNAAVSEAAK